MNESARELYAKMLGTLRALSDLDPRGVILGDDSGQEMLDDLVAAVERESTSGATIALQAQLDAVADALGPEAMAAADGYHYEAVRALRRRSESAELGCEIAYRREPTQAEGDAYEHLVPPDRDGPLPAGECYVPMGGWTGRRCRACDRWVWGGPTACEGCVRREADAGVDAAQAAQEATKPHKRTMTLATLRAECPEWTWTAHRGDGGFAWQYEGVKAGLKVRVYGTWSLFDAEEDAPTRWQVAGAHGVEDYADWWLREHA